MLAAVRMMKFCAKDLKVLNRTERTKKKPNLVRLPSDECHWALLMISQYGSDNGLVPSGNKPLPKPMLTLLRHHMTSLGNKHLNWIQ